MEEKRKLITKLTLLDTKLYRRNSFVESGKYQKEPKQFRFKLSEIYSKLNVNELKAILELKEETNERD